MRIASVVDWRRTTPADRKRFYAIPSALTPGVPERRRRHGAGRRPWEGAMVGVLGQWNLVGWSGSFVP